MTQQPDLTPDMPEVAHDPARASAVQLINAQQSRERARLAAAVPRLSAAVQARMAAEARMAAYKEELEQKEREAADAAAAAEEAAFAELAKTDPLRYEALRQHKVEAIKAQLDADLAARRSRYRGAI
jgi:hypothetical protein